MLARVGLVGLLALLLLHTGCAARSTGLPNAPIFNTGASATIIQPGQSAPPMPGYGQRTSSSAPGSYSGSSSGVPGYPGAPQPQLQPTGQPPLGTDMAMLGGAVTIDTREIRRNKDPVLANPLFWPFAPIVWPLHKLDRALNADDEARFREQAMQRIYQQTGVPMPERYPYAGREGAQVAQEQAEQQAMARQIQQQQSGDGMGAGSAPGQQLAMSGGSLSIADELAALRSGGSTQAPSSVAAEPAAAPVPGAAAADQVEDRDGDGRVDRWVYTSGGRNRELLDEDRDGRPERTVFYEPDGERVARMDEDSDGDGEVDSWTLYQDGEMARRRTDSNGDGEADTWTSYQGGKIARHEADSDGDGVRDRVDFYENGKLLRRTEDKDGDGRPERITLFDAKGRPSALEEDQDGDGQVDVRSHYSGGKLVRKELLDESQLVQ